MMSRRQTSERGSNSNPISQRNEMKGVVSELEYCEI